MYAHRAIECVMRASSVCIFPCFFFILYVECSNCMNDQCNIPKAANKLKKKKRKKNCWLCNCLRLFVGSNSNKNAENMEKMLKIDKLSVSRLLEICLLRRYIMASTFLPNSIDSEILTWSLTTRKINRYEWMISCWFSIIPHTWHFWMLFPIDLFIYYHRFVCANIKPKSLPYSYIPFTHWKIA